MSDLLTQAEQAAKLNNYQAAEQHCKQYLALNPSDKKGLRLLAHILSLDRQYDEAIKAVSRVIALSEGKSEPNDYFNRGRWRLEKRYLADAVSDFTTTIDLCARYADEYYLEAAYLHRAIAFMEMKSANAATQDLDHIGDECRTFALGKVYSKAVLSENRS